MDANIGQIICCPQCGSTDIKDYGGMCVCFSCRNSFPAPKEPKPFQPMRLFISYGHPESEICQRIYAALKERHHDVWFDDTNMAHGEDWREQITEGIVHSDGVISCLSKHSVRDPGVSLDELSIAIGVRGGNIKTVLLESEKEVQPPASVCHIQWLDMSQWREMLEQGKEVFEPWFDAKMDQLFEVIESEDSREFVGQINAIRDKLHVNYDTSKQKDLLRRAFVGRQWLAAQVEAWLDDPNGARLCVLYGDPGVGKSAFAARYIHFNPRVAAGLFCEYSRPLYNDPHTVIMTLAYLLACRLPNYRMVLSGILENEKRLGEMNPSELFDLLLATPLTSLVIDGGQEALCIVIDGLDECAQGERNALAEVLGQYAERLPSWLRVLATARDVAAVTAPLGEAFRLELRGGQEQNREDIHQYFIDQLQEKYGANPAWATALETLTERSGGIFLYATLVANGIRNGKVSIADCERFPEGLSGAFHQWFGWFFPDDEEYKEKFRMPLGAILAAPEALPVRELKRIFGWDDNEQNDFLRRIEVLLKRNTNDFGDETVSFSHQYLNEWLDTPEAGRFRSSRHAALEKMAERFYELFREDKDAVTYYEAVHMLRLLEESGQTERQNKLAADHNLFCQVIDAGDYCREWGKLDTALRCYEQARAMAEEAAKQGTPEVRRDLSVSYDRIADILEAKGQLDEALELFEKSLAIYEPLVQEQDTPEYRQDLSLSCAAIAGVMKEKGQLGEALALYEKALEIDEQLDSEQDTPIHRRGLSIDYEHVAGIMQMNGRLEEALALYKKTVAIDEQLAREQNTLENQWILSVGYGEVADIMNEKGQLDEALALYEKATVILERVICEQDTPGNRHNLSVSYERVADILEKKGRTDEALAQSKKAMAIRERLVRELDTPGYWRGLSISYNQAAEILATKGQLDEALAMYEKSMAIRERLVCERDTPEYWRGLSISYNQVAVIFDIQGRLDEALALHEKSMSIFERLACEQDTPERRRDLSVSCNFVADILARKGRLDEALALYEKSMVILERVICEQDTPGNRRNLSVSYDRVAGILETQDRLDEALALYEKSMVIREQLVREQDTPGNQWDLGASFERVAGILETQGQLDEALALYEKAIAIRVRLAHEQDTPGNRRDLSVSYSRVAGILKIKGQMDEALALYEKAIAIREQLVRERGTVNDRDALAVSCYNMATTIDAPEKQTYYAKRGLEISEMLLDATGNKRHEMLYRAFQELLDDLQT